MFNTKPIAPASEYSVIKITDLLKFGSIINGSDINSLPAAGVIVLNIYSIFGIT